MTLRIPDVNVDNDAAQAMFMHGVDTDPAGLDDGEMIHDDEDMPSADADADAASRGRKRPLDHGDDLACGAG